MEKFKRFSAVYALAAGICIPVLWIYILISGILPKVHSEPTAAVFLIVSELATAAFLLASGIGLLLKQIWAQKLWYLAMGMLLYAVVLAAGEFLQLNRPFFGPVFIVLIAATACVTLLSLLVKDQNFQA